MSWRDPGLRSALAHPGPRERPGTSEVALSLIRNHEAAKEPGLPMEFAPRPVFPVRARFAISGCGRHRCSEPAPCGIRRCCRQSRLFCLGLSLYWGCTGAVWAHEMRLGNPRVQSS